jgi:hypothetical protein
MTQVKAPLADVVDEGRRIAGEAAEAGLSLRLAGGVAVAVLCPSSRVPPLARRYADVDLVGRGGDGQAIGALFSDLGYTADEQFNALHGRRRLFFWDEQNQRQVDVFLNRIEMCHTLDVTDRLAIVGQTLPLADLLIMKLQVVETNEKDFLDILAMLVDQSFTDDDTGINLPYIVRLTSGDWGLWKTLTTVAEGADRFARRLPGFERADDTHAQVAQFLEALDQSPKSRAWRVRAKIGERKRWYELPEESH